MMDTQIGNWAGYVLCVVLGALFVAYVRAYYALRARCQLIDSLFAAEVLRADALEKQLNAILMRSRVVYRDGVPAVPDMVVVQERRA